MSTEFPEPSNNRTAPRPTSTDSLNVSEIDVGDCSSTAPAAGSVESSSACARATAGTASTAASTPTTIAASTRGKSRTGSRAVIDNRCARRAQRGNDRRGDDPEADAHCDDDSDALHRATDEAGQQLVLEHLETGRSEHARQRRRGQRDGAPATDQTYRRDQDRDAAECEAS